MTGPYAILELNCILDIFLQIGYKYVTYKFLSKLLLFEQKSDYRRVFDLLEKGFV